MKTREYVKSLNADQMARWLCLFEGVDLIFEELERNGMDQDFELDKRLFNKIDRSLNKYIRDRFHTVRADIIVEYGEF